MRSLIISLVLAAVILTGGIFYTSMIEDISDDFSQINSELMYYVDKEDYQSALGKAEEMKKYLDEKSTLLAAMGNHEEIDEIEGTLEELTSYIKDEKKADAGSKCSSLGFLFKHLPRNFKLKAENIL